VKLNRGPVQKRQGPALGRGATPEIQQPCGSSSGTPALRKSAVDRLEIREGPSLRRFGDFGDVGDQPNHLALHTMFVAFAGARLGEGVATVRCRRAFRSARGQAGGLDIPPAIHLHMTAARRWQIADTSYPQSSMGEDGSFRHRGLSCEG